MPKHRTPSLHLRFLSEFSRIENRLKICLLYLHPVYIFCICLYMKIEYLHNRHSGLGYRNFNNPHPDLNIYIAIHKYKTQMIKFYEQFCQTETILKYLSNIIQHR